jgi:hypothetical protein
VKIEAGFWQLTVGSLVCNEKGDGVVVQLMQDGALVKVCWPATDEVIIYTEDDWRMMNFLAYRIV